MRIAVCFNEVNYNQRFGQQEDLVSEAGSLEEAQLVSQALRLMGHYAELVPLAESVPGFMKRLLDMNPQVIFNLCEGVWGDSSKEPHVAALFELMELPFTGNNSLTLATTHDKALAKSLLKVAGVPTPPWFVAPLGLEVTDKRHLRFPLFVKPRSEDASLGIGDESVVTTMSELKRRVEFVHMTYGQDALVEEYIDGRELNLALIGADPVRLLPVSEIVFAEELPRRIVSYEGKWLEDSGAYGGTTPVCPAELSEEVLSSLEQLSGAVASHFGLRDYARIDVRLRDGVPYVLEVNANPDISPHAGFAGSAEKAGLTYEELVEMLLYFAVGRRW